MIKEFHHGERNVILRDIVNDHVQNKYLGQVNLVAKVDKVSVDDVLEFNMI